MPFAVRAGGTLSNWELISIRGGEEFWTLRKGYAVSGHIADDALWRSTPSAIWYWGFQNYTKICMSSDDEPSQLMPGGDPFPHPPIYADREFRRGAEEFLAGALGPELPAEGAEDIGPDLDAWSRRSYPENDTCPSQRALLNDLLQLSPYQIDPIDQSCADRIERLQESIA